MSRKPWPCEPKFKRDDYVYYHHKNKDTYPAIVLAVKNQLIKIRYNGILGDITTWVKQQNLSRQKRVL